MAAVLTLIAMRIPDAAEVVAAARAALAESTGREVSESDLAYELRRRYGIRAGQSQVNRWANGKGDPAYEATVALMEIAGWVSTNEGDRPGQQAPADPLAVLEGTLDRIRSQTAEGFSHLEQLLDALAERLPPQEDLGEESG